MICNECGIGEGKRYTKDRKTNLTYFYYCFECMSNIELIEKETKGDLSNY